MDISPESNIGNGCWSSAYIQEDGNVLLVSSDPAKKIMSKGLFEDHPMWPKVTMVAPKYEDSSSAIYKMERLQVISKLEDSSRYSNFGGDNPQYIIDRLIKHFPKEFKQERDRIITALKTLVENGVQSNVEFLDFNIAVKDKKLVFFDIFYPRSDRDKTVSEISNPPI
jgi:hypothetical protein